MLALLLLLLPLTVAAQCPEGCECGTFPGGGREVDCGLLKATLRQPLLEVQCIGPGEIGAADFDLLKSFGAVTKVKFNGCPLPPLSGLINVSTVEYLAVENSLQALNLSETRLDGFARLRYLQLSANGISELPEGIFEPLVSLERLELRENRLKTLPTLPKTLVALELGHNLLTEAPRALPKLKQLGLWKNRFGALAPLSEMPALESLDLSSNGLQAIASDAFAELPELRDLSLGKNRIKALPPGVFSQNKKLRRLRLNDNEGTLTLPVAVLADLPALEEVYIERTTLVSVPEEMLRNATALVNLTLSNCRLDTLPTSLLDDLDSLEKLDLSGNKLSAMPHFSRQLASLKVLRLGKNQISALKTADMSMLVKLEHIDLSSNVLEHVDKDAFVANHEVRHINLDNNLLSFSEMSRDYFGSYSPFHYCTRLEVISLRNNSIEEIFADWKISLVHLRRLDLRQNKLTGLLTDDLQFVSNNLEVDLRQNEISTIDLHYIANIAIANENTNARNVSVKLDGDAIDCTKCFTHSLLRYLEGGMHASTYSYVRLVVDKTNSCIANHTSKEFLCAIPPDRCLQNCTCALRPENKALILSCHSPPSDLGYLAKGKHLEVSLRDANLTGNFSAALYGQINTTVLRLSSNSIHNIVNLPSTLLEIDLDRNKFRHLSNEMLDRMNKTQRITLANNPWACDCDTLDMLTFVQRRFRAIADLGNVTCEDGRPLAKLTADDLCNNARVAVAASLAVAVAGIILGSLAAIYYKFQHQIKVTIYSSYSSPMKRSVL
jgi:protein toll